MPTVFLRELLGNGLCGRKSSNDNRRKMGYIATVLDKVILRGLLNDLSGESQRLQLASQYGIPYEEQPIFDRLLLGLHGNRHLLTGSDVSVQQIDADMHGTTVRFVRILCGNTVIEPVYDYHPSNGYLPMHALLGEVCSARSPGEVKVTSFMVATGDILEEAKAYPLNRDVLVELLENAVSAKALPGPQCLSCLETSCSFYTKDFENEVFEWMKAKQKYEELEAKIKKHLTYHGPTKAGTHLFYMDEHARRFFKSDKLFEEFFAALVAASPKGYAKFLSPDASEIFKAVEKKELPEALLAYFKQSRYWTIESRFSL